MRLALALPVLNHSPETFRCLDSFRSTAADWSHIELIVVDNGSEPPVSEWGIGDATIVRNEVNVGVVPALQQAHEPSTSTS